MASKKKEENKIDFQERVRYYIKQGKNRLTAIDLASEEVNNERDPETKTFGNNPRFTRDKTKGK
jgi:hypothetical protein